MAALRQRAAVYILLTTLLLSALVDLVNSAERYGSPSRYIAVARKKRSEPVVVTRANAESVSKGQSSASSGGAPLPPGLRSKRDATGTHDDDKKDKKPEIVEFQLKDSHQFVMIDWAGEGSDVIVCVTRDSEQTQSSASNVYISYDYGSTYEQKTENFKTKGGKPAIINKFYKNGKFTSRFVFTDVVNKYIYTTLDNGMNVTLHKLVFSPSELVHHPIDPDVLVVYDTEDKERKLWVSEDFGETWRMIGIYVKSYYWSEVTNPPTLYVERQEPSDVAAVTASQDLFRDQSSIKTVITDVEDFEVKDEFLFAIKKVHLFGSHSSEPQLQLWVSYRQGPFLNSEFPSTLSHQHYYIADISEGQVMVCVAHDQVMSNLYVSSVPRSSNHQLRFSLSLERILYFNPTKNWVDTWLSVVADKTFADLHPVEGIRGVFIASQLVANYTKSTSTLGPEHLTSYITFDQGGIWKPIQPPRVDVDGNTINCSRLSGCSLHLSQEFSQLYPASPAKPILSKKSAPGLILATGTIGTSLKGHPALYLSTDAGINWYQVRRGSYLYTLGDHGGIIIAVQMYQANGTTNVIQYSTDEGETWNEATFYDEKIRVYGLITEPGENTTVFTIFGSESEKHQWIFIKVDMKPVFQYACNKDNDYKTWSPTDGRRGHNCLLGRKQVYERRIPHANCYNGIDYDRPVSVENCPCNRDDFECDFGFKITDSLDCAEDTDDAINPYDVPAVCLPGHFYNRTRGYRKVPGDTCEGGREYLYRPTITACPVTEEQEFLLVSTRQEIMRYDLVNPQAGLEPLPIQGLRMVIALDFDMENNSVYWSDVDEKKIKRLCFDGHHDVETLVDNNLHSVEGLALDWIAKNLYFVDGERKTLEVIRTDISNYGRMRRTLLDSKTLDNPRGIAVHPVHGLLYITDWSESKPMVACSYLDGTNLTVLFGASIVGWPNGITIDFETDRIFFADAKLDYIASADLDGKNMKKIIVNSDKVMQPFALGVYKSLIFWDDWTVHQVLQADKELGIGVSPISNFTRKGLVDLKVFSHWSQQGSNACGERKSPVCSHLCLGRPNNAYSCLCPDGLKAIKNGTNEHCVCPDGSKIQDDGTCLSEGSTCATNFFKCGNGRCIPRQWVCDIDNDCGDNSDETEKECGRKPCEAPAWQCANGHCIAPGWRCDYDNDCGDNSDEEDCHPTECPANTYRCKNGRCIHPNWVCDMEDDCRDGSDEQNCTTSHKNQCRGTEFTCSDGRCLPGSWRCDGDSDCADGLDEKNCTNVTCESWQFQCNSKQCIFRTWRCDGEADCHDKSDEVDCGDIPITTAPPLIPFGPLVPPTSVNCTALMFRCRNANCIPFWWRCDGLDDCGDTSDEEDCDHGGSRNVTTVPPARPDAPSHTCKTDQFSCSDGTCIWESWVCDNDKDCPKGEDEDNCHQTQTCAERKGFTCHHSGGCIPSESVCNGQKDCADGSDEEVCSPVVPRDDNCPPEYFSCDGGACLESFRRCDGNHNCVDLTDEQNCSGSVEKAYAVTKFVIEDCKNVSATVSWEVNDNANNTQSLEYMPSLIIKAMTGNPAALKNFTWLSESSKTFTDLTPYTYYLLKVYVRVKGETKEFPPVEPFVFRTEVGVPSPPVDVAVHQVEDDVIVSWKPPVSPNGPIANYKVSMSPPMPPRQVLISGNATNITVPSSSIESPCKVWVTAANTAYASSESESVEYIRKSVNSLVNWRVVSANSSAATLEWHPIDGVEGYVVSHSRPENDYLLGEVLTNTTDTHITVTNLAPSLKYMFKVRAAKNDMLGPASPTPVTTSGNPLTPVKGLHCEVMKDFATTVKLTWDEPAYNSLKVHWEYRIVWGKSISELKHHLNENSENVGATTNTSYVIRGLEACEIYKIVVMVGGPIGIGPVETVQVSTGPDSLAPPKNLRAIRPNPSGTTMKITWERACAYKKKEAIHYELRITDDVMNKSSYFQLPSKEGVPQSHEVEVHYGGQYSVSVRHASLSDARYSQPVVCSGPPIPPPYELTFNPSDESFFWRVNPAMPSNLIAKNNTFELFVSKNSNMSEAKSYSSFAPPLIIDDLSPGIIYYAAVALKDADGYLSPKSSILRIEKPIGSEIVLSQNSVVGVAVSVFLVVVALVVIVAIMAVRHRRLARSFLTFANTHYDRSQGTTLITTDHNLDEDDDSPMIRGFSDDEPMVIA